MKATIKDVARVAGVSPSTVSRALHNNPRISEEVRARVRHVARELDFHPNQMARSLVNRRTRIVGIVFPGNVSKNLGNPFYPLVLQGLGHTASERRYHMLLATGSEAVSSLEAARQLVDSGYVSGLVLLAAEDAPFLELGVPVVVVGHPTDADTWCYVDNNNVAAGYAATRYLLERGHRRIMFMGYDKQFIFTADRRKGYEQALREADEPVRRDWIAPPGFLQNSLDSSELSALFRTEIRPTAAVCADDTLAIGLSGVLKSMGLGVPEDVSVISFNNTEAGRYHIPALTSFDVDPYSLGTCAMHLMLDMLSENEDKPTSIEVPFTLYERDSVATIGPSQIAKET